jgi:hypothetical protein
MNKVDEIKSAMMIEVVAKLDCPICGEEEKFEKELSYDFNFEDFKIDATKYFLTMGWKYQVSKRYAIEGVMCRCDKR